jgi:histidinol-phosphate/aromatic aminotransferase/cobyric acid decarboxylase-like protein
MMATFMAAMESSIVATAMPTIVAELGGFHLFSWAFAAYRPEFAAALREHAVLVRHFNKPRTAPYLRITVGRECDTQQLIAAAVLILGHE